MIQDCQPRVLLCGGDEKNNGKASVAKRFFPETASYTCPVIDIVEALDAVELHEDEEMKTTTPPPEWLDDPKEL